MKGRTKRGLKGGSWRLPVPDTEALFALNRKDRKHDAALKVLSEVKEGGERILLTCASMLEFVIVLRSIGKKPRGIGVATLALKVAVRRFNGGGSRAYARAFYRFNAPLRKIWVNLFR